MTQSQFAQVLGVDPITVSRWERGEHEPSLATLRQIADATDRTLTWFFLDEAA